MEWHATANVLSSLYSFLSLGCMIHRKYRDCSSRSLIGGKIPPYRSSSEAVYLRKYSNRRYFFSGFRNITSAFLSLNTFVLAIARRRCRIVGEDDEQDKQKSKSLKTVEYFELLTNTVRLKKYKHMFLPYKN